MNDAVILLRDIAGDAASNAAGKINPSDEQLATIDHAAEDNTWHEKPDLSGANIKSQIQSALPIGKKELDEAAGDAAQAAHPSGSRDPAAVADAAAQDQQAGTSQVNGVAGAKAGAKTLQQRISEGTPEEQKQKLREYRERTNEYFKNKMPKERREQIIYRLKKMVVEIQGHRDCKWTASY